MNGQPKPPEPAACPEDVHAGGYYVATRAFTLTEVDGIPVRAVNVAPGDELRAPTLVIGGTQ
jgi:hypothetical protein